MAEQLTYIELNLVGNMGLAILAVIPFIVNLRYYRKTKIFDYLLLAIYFFIWSVLNMFEHWYWGASTRWFEFEGGVGKIELLDSFYTNHIRYFLWTLDSIPLFFIGIRAKYGSDFSKLPKIVYAIALLTVSLTVWSWIDQSQFRIHEDIIDSDSQSIARFTSRFLFHAFLAYIFLTVDHEKSNRTDTSRYLWIVGSIGWVFAMGIGLIFPSVFRISAYTNLSLLIVGFTLVNIAYLLLVINHAFFPEAVLFTHEQIVRAFSVYERVELTNSPIKDFGLSRIQEYLDSIPEELKVELSIQQS
jgi:hypothetical protein